jgi:hypothetical protein
MSLKKIIGLLLVGFFIFFIIQSPGEAARVVKVTGDNLGDILSSMASSFSDFLTQLF